MPGKHPVDSVADSVPRVMRMGHDESSARAICEASINGESENLERLLKETGSDEWVPTVRRMAKRGVTSEVFSDVVQTLSKGRDLSKSQTLEKVAFEANVQSAPTIFKAGDEFIVWGPASVEVVDKEGDKIQAKALSSALPQLLKRARLSLDHSDQLVGRILERFDTEETVTVKIGDRTYERSEFPTEVLELDGLEPALFVAGEIYGDTRQARETRRRIENGELNSYSISGEALVTRKKIERDGSAYNDIVDLDLSAVTVCEEGMNQKAKFGVIESSGKKTAAATAKADTSSDPAPNVGRVPSTRAVASLAKTAISETMSEHEEKSESPSGEFSLESLQKEFKTVLDEKLPDGELATKEDLPEVLTREDVEGIARDVVEGSSAPEPAAKEEDDAGEQDGHDSGHSDAEARPGEEADVTGEEAEKGEGPVADVAAEYGLTTKEVEDLLARANKDDDEDEDEAFPEEEEVPVEDDLPPVEEEAEDVPPVEDVPVDEDVPPVEEEPPVDVEPEDGEPAGDDDVPDVAVDDEDEEIELQEDASSGFSEEELEEMLPADVYEVVREYLGGDDAAEDEMMDPEMMEDEGAPEEVMASAKSDDIEKAVERVLAGKGVTNTGGASAPSGEMEKSYSEDESSESKHGNHPALSNFYK